MQCYGHKMRVQSNPSASCVRRHPKEWRRWCDQTAMAEALPSGCVVVNRIAGLMGLSVELEQLLLYRDVRLLLWETRDLSFVSSLTP